MNNVILKMTDITKSFSGVKALKGAALELRAGEVHALMGENGAGKSTLMKILTGIYERDSGEVEVFGEKVEFQNVKESQEKGIAIIHQELNMMKDLTVAQNIFIGREYIKFGVFIDDGKMEKEAKKLLDYVGVNISPRKRLGDLTVGKQQMVEIAKAISHNSKLLILDEPTAALTSVEVDDLFRIMKELKSKGIGMIYISHRMDEIKRISDRVTVMRDGEYIGTVNTNETDNEEIVKMMVGRVILGKTKEKSACPDDAPTVLEVKNLNVGNTVKNVSFSLKKGEILGFSGLMGAGRTEVARALFGADKKDSGEIKINGKLVNIETPEQAVSQGICYISEDRKRFGLLLDKSVTENSVLASVGKFTKFGFIDDISARKEAEKVNKKLRTKTSSMSQILRNLSGGNQQKVVVARWLIKDADIFIFDEPTRGIDIGAKSEMYELMEELVKKGKSIIMISSELAEIQRCSDRVIVMCEGRKTAELPIEEATQENIMKYAMMRSKEGIA
ncbi:MAG: sugar ABC transporter ATP-binding protein [Clostridia bacterium]|nr:sugar ABC transporter ATP-binding protein [Clostridia bacterium]